MISTGHFLETCHAKCQETTNCQYFAFANADAGDAEGTCELYLNGACTETVAADKGTVTGFDLFAK
jgi:hypothetical protein